MSIETVERVVNPTSHLEIVNYEDRYAILDKTTGQLILNSTGTVRVFSSRNSAHKRISRIRSGNFNK